MADYSYLSDKKDAHDNAIWADDILKRILSAGEEVLVLVRKER